MQEETEYHQTKFEHVSTVMQPATPVKWTPEDAANFIASAIREAQRPTMEAIRRRGVSKWFYAFTCFFFCALLGVAGYYIYYLTLKLDGAQVQQTAELDARYDAAVKAAGEKFTAAAAALEQSARTSQNLVDTAAAREQLNAVRKENGAQLFTIENQKGRIDDLQEKLNAANEKLSAAEARCKELSADIAARKEAMTNIDADKAAAAAEIEKLKSAVALRDTAIEQQREEIAILRKRLDTAQAMNQQ